MIRYHDLPHQRLTQRASTLPGQHVQDGEGLTRVGGSLWALPMISLDILVISALAAPRRDIATDATEPRGVRPTW
jgi:hypothetical protein